MRDGQSENIQKVFGVTSVLAVASSGRGEGGGGEPTHCQFLCNLGGWPPPDSLHLAVRVEALSQG